MAQMASGANYVSGTFTVPDDETSTYTLNFGKTFSKYLFFIELTDASKTIVINSGASNYRPFCLVGSYPQPQINNVVVYGGIAWTYTPSSHSYSNGRFTTSSKNFTETSMKFATDDVTGTATSALLKGCTYNYYIVEIK